MQIPLKQRIKQIGQAEMMTAAIKGETVGSILLGASLLSRLEYLFWQVKGLYERYAAPDMALSAFNYRLIVHHAAKVLSKREEVELQESGRELLCKLAIEPYYFMEREKQEQERRKRI